MEKTVKLIFEGKTYEFPIIVGTEGEMAIDIRKLREKTGLITYDPGFANTGSCKSKITYIMHKTTIAVGLMKRWLAARG